jgi:hypothetical protein
LVCCSAIKPEAAFDKAVKLVLLDFGWFAVEGNDMNEQRRRSQTGSAVVKRPLIIRCGRNYIGDELAQSVEH